MKKVLFLFGGRSSEHFVSCKSLKSIIENIDKNSFEYEMVGITQENEWYIFNDNLSYLEEGNWREGDCIKVSNIIDFLKHFDVVFPIMHGTTGEDGKLQGLLEFFQIPFVGCKSLASAIGMDKEMSKMFFKSIGISQVPYLVFNGDIDISSIEEQLSYPVIIKPANGGSSIGIRKANNQEELMSAIEEAKKYDHKLIVEKFIKARELEVAILEEDGELLVSNIGEIKINTNYYDYEAKYVDKESYTVILEDLSLSLKNQIQESALRIFKKMNCSGYARIDFFYDEERSELYINEINTIPGFTTISMYPKLIENSGIPYQELITILIDNAK